MNQERDCLLKMVDLKLSEMMLGFAIRKGSPWKHPISRKILKYIENGEVSKLNRKWQGISCHDANKNLDGEKYPFQHFLGMYACLVGAIIILLAISICMYFKHRKCSYRIKQQRRWFKERIDCKSSKNKVKHERVEDFEK